MFQTIVLTYDGSTECRDALADGIALATRFNARCHLLAVLPPMNSMAIASGYIPEGLLDSDQAHYNGILEEGVSRLRQAGVQATGTLKTWVDPSQAIGAFALTWWSSDITGDRRWSAGGADRSGTICWIICRAACWFRCMTIQRSGRWRAVTTPEIR